jgi:serine/threonine protein kinase
LGGGGFGEVWEALSADGTRKALKFLPCEGRQSAAREIRALQSIMQLRHRHLIRVEQVWCYTRSIVLTMELADGSMEDLLATYRNQLGTPIAPEHVCYLLPQAADALDFLNLQKHQLNGQSLSIQHCDIKPSNLLLFGDTLKIADFGLVSALSSQTEHRNRSGTMNYCAPEVLQGRVSTYTDQYSLAVTYCELRGGRFPFEDTADAGRRDYVRRPADLEMLPSAERSIVARALSPVPQDRWPSCREFIGRLAKLVYEGASRTASRVS